MKAQRRPSPWRMVSSSPCTETTPSATSFSDSASSTACSRFSTNPSISRVSRAGTCPTCRNSASARSIAMGEVQGEGQSSTIGTRCGGFTGWATRQRAAPASPCDQTEGIRAELDEAKMTSGPASRSRSANSARLISAFSGPFSCTQSAPSSASASVEKPVARAAMPGSAPASRIIAAMSVSSRASTAGSASQTRTGRPARAKTKAHERPISPAPTIAIVVIIPPKATAPDGADPDRWPAPATGRHGRPGPFPAPRYDPTAPAQGPDCDRQ